MNATVFFIIEEAKESILDFSRITVRVYYKFILLSNAINIKLLNKTVQM